MQPVTVDISTTLKWNASTVRSQKGMTDANGKIYKDFDGLHRALSGKFQGIPALPPKKGEKDKKARTDGIKRGFGAFLNSVLTRADVAGDNDLCRFIALEPSIVLHGLKASEAPPQPQEMNHGIQQEVPAAPPAQPLSLQLQEDEEEAPAPPGLEDYAVTDGPAVPEGYEEYQFVEEPPPEGEETFDIPTEGGGSSPTPLPAAATPGGILDMQEQSPRKDFSPTPLPVAATPENKVVELVVSPDAYEGQYAGTDDEILIAWIKDLLDVDLSSEPSLQEALKSGVVLCNLINRISSDKINRIETSSMPFPQRENVKAFCDACRELGVPDRDNFTTEDLYENKNFKQVILCMFSLSRHCYYVPGYSGPCIGRPELAKTGKKPSKFPVVQSDALWGKANSSHYNVNNKPKFGDKAGSGSFKSPLRP